MSTLEKNQWQWGLGVLTTGKRTPSTLARTLESFRGTGFGPPVVFSDNKNQGGLWNLSRALVWLIEKYPQADAYGIIEDDVLFCKGIREYLEQHLWPGTGENGCICSVFTPTTYRSEKQWHTENRGSKTWMSQFRIYHPVTAKKLAQYLTDNIKTKNPHRQNDACVGQWALDNKIDIWFHSPSLTQHLCSKATSYGQNKGNNYRLGMARDFIGEDCSINGFSRDENFPVQKLPVLDIYSDSHYPEGCYNRRGKRIVSRYPDFQFTPAMARNLAGKLNEYNCDVESMVFCGGEPLLWKYWEECIDILRMTGKVMSMRMVTSLMEGAEMKPFESIYDKIIVRNVESNQHLIERYVQDQSLYIVIPRGKPFSSLRSRIPGTVPCECPVRRNWLFGDKVYFCPNTLPLLSGDTDLKMSQEERDSYCWSLDEFLINSNKIRSEFGKRGLCEACHDNPNVWK